MWRHLLPSWLDFFGRAHRTEWKSGYSLPRTKGRMFWKRLRRLWRHLPRDGEWPGKEWHVLRSMMQHLWTEIKITKIVNYLLQKIFLAWTQQCAWLQKKCPLLHYTVLFSVSYFNCINFTSMYLDFLVLSIKTFVKVLNNPGILLVGT